MSTAARARRNQASPLPFPVAVPFVESLGMELHGYGDGQAELWIDLDAAHLNTWEVAHGGVVMTMLDVAMALAARSGSGHSGGVATIEMKTSFMRPAEHRLRSIGKVLHKTSTLVFCEATLCDDRGRLCATATGTFKALRGLPAQGRVATPTPPPDPGTDNPPAPAADNPKGIPP